jgi:hypothetical protein
MVKGNTNKAANDGANMATSYRIKKDGKYWTGYNWAPTAISAEEYCSRWEASGEAKKVGGEIEKHSYCNG